MDVLVGEREVIAKAESQAELRFLGHATLRVTYEYSESTGVAFR